MAIMLRHQAWPSQVVDQAGQQAGTAEENWRCLIHFPDGSQGIHLIPGPAPVPTPDSMAAIVEIDGRPGTWFVREITTLVSGRGCAAEIWVEPA